MLTWATTAQGLRADALVHLALVILTCGTLAACGGNSPASPSSQGGLRLAGSTTRTVIPAGQTATITFRLQNDGSDTVTLNFSDGCQLNTYVAKVSGEVVYPPGGNWVCTLALTSLTLRPGESTSQDVRVASWNSSLDAYTPLKAGDYLAYAKVTSRERSLQSDPVRFTVQ